MKYLASPFRQQLGGTLTGLVVGLLVGLGIALAVAVYVTRVPVPFVDRGVSRKPAQDAEEAERNKGWNPNAGLAGQPPPPPSPPAVEAAGAIVVPSVGDSGVVTAPPGDAPDDDPLGDLVRSKLGGSSPTSPTAPASGPSATVSSAVPNDGAVYFVQAGAFRTPDDAQAQRARLAMIGMSAEVTEREQSGRTVYRVRVGPFNQKPLAEATREQLEINGVEAALVRIQR